MVDVRTGPFAFGIGNSFGQPRFDLVERLSHSTIYTARPQLCARHHPLTRCGYATLPTPSEEEGAFRHHPLTPSSKEEGAIGSTHHP